MAVTTHTHQVLLIQNGTTLRASHNLMDIHRAFPHIGHHLVMLSEHRTRLAPAPLRKEPLNQGSPEAILRFLLLGAMSHLWF